MSSAPLGHRENPARRRAARVLLVNAEDRVLLFHGRDPGRPGSGYWFTVGGGLDGDETAAQGAARELAEETGLRVAPHELGEPVWKDVTEFPFDHVWHRQEQQFFLYRIPDWEVSTAAQDEIELAWIDGHRWWSVAELAETGEPVYPEQLAQLLREILDV